MIKDYNDLPVEEEQKNQAIKTFELMISELDKMPKQEALRTAFYEGWMHGYWEGVKR